jgi:acyl-ACP thioesterase
MKSPTTRHAALDNDPYVNGSVYVSRVLEYLVSGGLCQVALRWRTALK